MRPGPTATTGPSWGFSLAVSGMTRPEAVVVSASLAWTTTRSSSGLMLTLVAVVTSVTPPSVSDGWWMWGGGADAVARDPGTRRRGGRAPARVDWHSTHESASRSTGCPTGGPGPLREACIVPTDPAEDDAVASLRWLRTAEGTTASRLAADLL